MPTLTSIHIVRILTAGILLAGCSTGRDTGVLSQSTKLLLVVSGDTQGWIVPCGCASNQSGGLLRRGTYLADLAKQAHVIYADAGGAPSGTKAYDREKFLAILRGEADLGIKAHNIGAAEGALGQAELQRIAQEAGVPLVSANVQTPQGKSLAPAYRLAETAGRRVLLIGVLSPQFQTDELRIAPPQQAVLDVLDQTAGQRDFVIVLAYLPEEELHDLTARLPEVDAIIGGPTGQAMAPQKLGPALLAAATNKGKFLVELELPQPGQTGLSGRVVELNDQYADDPLQQENLQTFYEVLRERDFTPEQTSFAPEMLAGANHYQVAGTHRCQECHPNEMAIWEQTAHAHAWVKLATGQAQVDSYCQQCHTTGYGHPRGFRSRAASPHLVNVGCESCHGPSQAHAADPALPTGFRNAAARCTKCHDHDNSPEFDYATYWTKVAHGEKEVSARSAKSNSSASSSDSRLGAQP